MLVSVYSTTNSFSCRFGGRRLKVNVSIELEGREERDYKFEISIVGISTILGEKRGFGIYLEIAGYIP